ncbi:DUF1905 domain-containing protein [Candidatus Saccharibacteria bacterium]|jgi:hypothetical protein|nr:DUF1905 domain-containing protein [Candidatus Saccharibacteria bacterium]
MEFNFRAELWEWQGQAAWCFVSLPQDYYHEIKLLTSQPKKGFGSVKVEAGVGSTIWRTSIFPDSKSGTYLLPIKKSVRKSESIEIGDELAVQIRLIDF